MPKAWTRFCTRMLGVSLSGTGEQVVSDCGGCSAIETRR